MFLAKSTEPRDVENSGSRFWVIDLEDDTRDDAYDAIATDWVGVADEIEGGIVAYIHPINAPRLIEALRAFTGGI